MSGDTRGLYPVKPLSITQTTEKLLLSKASYYRLAAEGLLPPPIKLTSNRSAVFEHEIDEVIIARAAGANDSTIKKLVADLVSARSNQSS
jgi:predicted DNA-binding transcriptional regulator AlpA